jgi:hypothetical protein
MHPPVLYEILETGVSAENAYGAETKHTCKLMLEHGLNNVRGAQFCLAREYTEEDLFHIASTIGHSLGMVYEDVQQQLMTQVRPREVVGCLKCGRKTHDTSNCFAKTHLNGRVLESPCFKKKMVKTLAPSKPPAKKVSPKNNGCWKCGRTSHFAADCFARTHVDGHSLDDDSDGGYSSGEYSDCSDY